MSLPDYLLDDDGEVCIVCGEQLWTERGYRCRECESDNDDLYADMKIQDAKEGK